MIDQKTLKILIVELQEGDFSIEEFANLAFEIWFERQPMLYLEKEKAREIYDIGFMMCERFIEEAVLPNLKRGER